MTTYTLNEKARALAEMGATAGNTLQAPSKGLGQAWRTAGYKAPNTRAVALAALVAHYPSGFTFEQAVGVLQGGVKAQAINLGSGTPRSYCKAFVANGYFAEVAEPVVEAEPVAEEKPKRKGAK